jgi:SSS family solute:Na+ symporter
MDLLQLIFAFVNAPLFATFMLGMFWKRTTGNAAFWGLITGTFAAALHYALTISEGKGGWLAHLVEYPSAMAQGFYTAIYAFIVCLVLTVILSLTTKQLKSDEELTGLVYSLTPKTKDEPGIPWYDKPVVMAVIIGAISIIITIIIW